MKLFNHLYYNAETLNQFITDSKIPNSQKVLLQIFSGKVDKKLLQNILDQLTSALPEINIIGATSFSEISDGNIHKRKVLLSFSVYEKSTIKTLYTPDDTAESGKRACRALASDDTKCMIIFSEALQTDGIPFIEGIQAEQPEIVLAGGYAADDYAFQETCVIHGNKLYSKGIVLASLSGKELRMHNDYALNWRPFGKSFEVTKCKGNVVCELNGQPVKEVIRHYYGQQALDNVPISLIEFPLLKEIEGTLVARSTIAETEDGLLYAGDFKVGDLVRFGVGDIENMHANAMTIIDKLQGKSIEGIYIYSCTARRTFLGTAMDIEINMLNEAAKTAGFFTYGEIYNTGNTTQVLNLTTTFLTISESAKVTQIKHKSPESSKPKGLMLKYLTNFINTMAAELEENIREIVNYKDILDQSTIVSKTDLKGVITYVNEAFCNISEYTPEEVIGKTHSIVKHPETPKELHQTLWTTIKAGKTWRGILKNMSKSGRTNYLDTIIIPIEDKNGTVIEYMGVRHDMTKIIKQEQLINEQLTDSLTKLPNRVKLFNDLDSKTVEYLAILNIDGFKGINDLYGFDVADLLLVELSGYIKNKLNHNMTLYRIGGDVFVVTCSSGIFELFKEKILNLITDINKNVFECSGYNIDLNMTAGLAYDTSRLLTSAEVALRNAKKNGLIMDTITKNSPEANIYLENTKWLKVVKEALADGNILNYYQPIVNLSNPEDKKYEALIRLKDSDGKIHTPHEFLQIVKQTTEYEHLTKTVLFNVYEICSKYPYNFTINLSAQDLRNESTIIYMKQLFSMRNLAERITLEITESEAIIDYDFVDSFISEFKTMGCKIAIDDFGSGYSNFAYLAQFNVDFLKIDGSIVKRVLQDRNALITMESILDFAKRLGVKTIAEFVSDEDIYNKMTELGVDYVQGYHLGKPAPLI